MRRRREPCIKWLNPLAETINFVIPSYELFVRGTPETLKQIKPTDIDFACLLEPDDKCLWLKMPYTFYTRYIESNGTLLEVSSWPPQGTRKSCVGYCGRKFIKTFPVVETMCPHNVLAI